MNFKKLCSVVFFFIILPTITNANEKIVYIDLQSILTNSLAGKSIASQIKKFDQKHLEVFKKKESELKKEETNLISQKNILSEVEFNKKANQLKKKINLHNKEKKKKVNDITKKQFEAQNKILTVLKKKLEMYASENSINLILQKKNILLGDNKINITNIMMDLLNKELKTVSLK
jgi:Skp family chaperone for outer membrane proteins